MALATYTDLQASVASWLKRSDLTAIIPDLIAMAEGRMSGDINSRDMEVRTVLTVSSQYVTLPTDMLEMRRLILQTDPIQKLRYVSPDQLSQEYAYSTTGRPAVFTVIGGSLQLGPAPDSTSYTLELTYRQRIPALASNSTNWLLTKFPQAYIYATLCEAAPYIVGDERLPMWEKKYAIAVQTINSIDWYSGATMTMQSDIRRG